ncbi:hypothetical protein UNPF46_15095 [Bradyrhizobium sp. UNPF46]|uniref:caspase family protein n=1 Tax=Bradyrhizobium sp. UNPF46 TaxID=1141168 RepID=UPI0011530E5F|nr:caspase family protein [Bradyrhizobium sp. UNPF46]TQF38764.1 hypothetical protein UNPF46_15095 [Bradyrhizobium sp. UNPF46]
MTQAAENPTKPKGLVTSSQALTNGSKPAARRKALIVGIDNYPPPNALPSCVADAHAMASLLKAGFGFEDQVVLVNEDATKANLVGALTSLVADCDASDRLVFFFSGHGYRPVRNGVLESALVSQDAQFFEDSELASLMKGVPPGVLTIITDACFSGGMEKLFVRANGQIEVGKLKRWISLDPREVESHRDDVAAATAFCPFGYLTPAPAAALQDNLSMAKGAAFQIAQLRQTDSKAILVSACLEDETAAASTSQTRGMSAFTYALTSTIGSLGAAPSSQAVIEAAGKRLREIAIKQTPMLKCPPQPAALAGQEFILHNEAQGGTASVQDRTIASTHTDQRDSEQQAVARVIATFLLMTGGLQVPSDIQQKDLSDIIRIAVPLISMLQSRGAGSSAPDKGFDIGQIASTVLPIVMSLQSKGAVANGNGAANKDFLDDVGRIVNIATTVAPIIAGLQSKGAVANGNGAANKDFLDDVGRVANIAATVIPIIAGLQSKGAVANGTTDKDFLNDVARVVDIAGKVVPLVTGQTKGAVTSGNGATNKDFIDDVGRVAGIVVPIIASLQAKGGNGAASKSLFDDFGPDRVTNRFGLPRTDTFADKGLFDIARVVVPIVAAM